MKIILCKKLNFGFECDNPLNLLTSQWQKNDKSLGYVIYRVVIAIFFNFSYINSLIFSARRNELLFSFIYLTRLNSLATAITCNIGAYYVASFYLRKLEKPDRMTFGLKFYWFMYNAIIPFACIISLVYWTLLFGTEGEDGMSLNNVLVHMTNSLVLLIDFLIVRHEYRVMHFIHLSICGFLYLIFTITYTLIGGVNELGKNYVYHFLNWKEDPSKASLVAAIVLIILCMFHFSLCGFAFLKQKLHDFLYEKSKNCVISEKVIENV